MAIICEVKGTITTAKASRVSVHKLLFPDGYCEVSGNVKSTEDTENGRYRHEVNVYAVRDGKWASDWLQDIINAIKKQDPTANVDLTMVSRWF